MTGGYDVKDVKDAIGHHDTHVGVDSATLAAHCVGAQQQVKIWSLDDSMTHVNVSSLKIWNIAEQQQNTTVSDCMPAERGITLNIM